jgi:hypothetical protein
MGKSIQGIGKGAREKIPAAAFFFLVCCLQACALMARQGTIAYLAVTTGSKDIEIQIHKSFIERYRNRVTIDAALTVDRVMPSPVPASLDGDLHFSGRAPQIGLPVVAEISNAAFHKDAMEIAHRAGGSGTSLKVSGVWRIWPEHSGSGVEVQGDPLTAYTMANPNHVFEIHPITRLGGLGLLDSFVPIDGFKPGDAKRTFGIYEKAPCMLKVQPETVSIVMQPGLYNDVEFLMELTNDQQRKVDDGRFVDASVRDLKGDLIVDHIRMVFAAGTPPEMAVRGLKRGDRLHVYGMPRLDFAEISRRVKGSEKNPALLTGTVPYEIIIVGMYAK